MALHQTFQLIQLKRGTAADLVELNPLLEAGEIIIELDTGRFKIGNGELYWLQLPYANSSSGYSSVVALSDVIGLQTALNNKQPAGDYALNSDPRLTDARTPVAHTHTIADVAGLDEALDQKQPIGDYAFFVDPPASASSSGVTGAVARDTNFFYVCVAPNTWMRAALSTWT
jgi:hypothetical protein